MQYPVLTYLFRVPESVRDVLSDPWRVAILPRLPIMSIESDAVTCLPDSSLPNFYMADHTVLGLRVGNLDATVRVLKKSGINVFKGPDYNELSIGKIDQLPHIIQLLNANNISCVIADVLEEVYQG
jgi:hypothetical protein